MKEPKRLLSQGATDFERQLLRAVVNERPSALLRSRMQRGLGLVGPLAWASTVKAMLGGAAGKITGAVALGVLAVAGATALHLIPSPAGVGGEASRVSVASPAPEPSAARDEPTSPLRDEPTSTTTAAEMPVAPNPVAPSPVPVDRAQRGEAQPGEAQPGTEGTAVAASPPQSDEEDRRLREEIALLDTARGALERGDRQAARESLRTYRERFPAGVLAREANVLRRRAEPSRAHPRPAR